MASESYLERLRTARSSPSVIKTRFVTLAGACGEKPILAFEGDDDKIVYGRWIARIRPALRYEVFVCKGKRGVSTLKSIVDRDLNSLNCSTYFFIDRDYDELLHFENDNNVFMTDRYSVENYLVSKEVVDSVLRDELPLDAHPTLRADLVACFEGVYARFLDLTKDFNKRLFISRRVGMSLSHSLSDSLSDYVCLKLDSVESGGKTPNQLVVFSQEINDNVMTELALEFEQLPPSNRYRGKNAYMFLKKWFTIVVDHLTSATGPFEGHSFQGKVRSGELTLGTYASKSAMPLMLPSFIDTVVQ